MENREGQKEKQKHKLKTKAPQGEEEEPMEEQNRLNKEKDRKTQRQETELVTGRVKVGEGAIRKVKTQGVCTPKPKPAGEKMLKKRA